MLQGIASPMLGAASMKSEKPEVASGRKEAPGLARSSFEKALNEKINSTPTKPDSISGRKSSDERNPKSDKTESRMTSGRERKAENAETRVSKAPETKDKKATDEVNQRGTTKNSGQAEKKSSVRQQQLLEFMDSFESEFQISPTRLVESIAELSDADLLKSPVETVDKVIANLELPEEEEAKAKALYMALLMQNPPKETAPAMVGLPIAGASGSLQTEETLQRSLKATSYQQENLQKIDSINGKFWSSLAKDSAKPVADSSKLDAQAFEKLESNISLDEMMSKLNPETAKVSVFQNQALENALKPATTNIQTIEGAEAGVMTGAMAGAEQAMAAQLGTDGTAPGSASLKDLLGELQLANKEAEVALKDLLNKATDLGLVESPTEFMEQAMAEGQSQFQGESQGDSSSLLLSQGKESEMKLNSKKFDDFQNSLASLDIFGSRGLEMKPSQVAPMVGLAAQAGADKAEAMQKLVHSAQLLSTQGGGEMKVELNSQELGVVNLKVAMEDGKLSVHMAAQSEDAKKALESSLAELKTSLAAQKLSMDNVKIDVVDNAKMSSALQNQMNQGGGDPQQQTRQFWNQFHNNFGDNSRGDSWTEMTGIKSYARRRDPLAPLDAAPAPRAVDGKGSGLNLVA